MTTPRQRGLCLFLLGPPDVTIDGVPLPRQLMRKACALLYYLAVTGEVQSREAVADLLWPQMTTGQALKNLRTTLPELRKYVGDYLTATRQTIGIKSQSAYHLDVNQLHAGFTNGVPERPIEELLATAQIYRGEFLQGFYVRNASTFDEWVHYQRVQLQAIVIKGLSSLAERCLVEHLYELGLEATAQLLELEPWLESGHRQQMQLLVASGQRGAALKQYETCCKILATEFGLEPAAETVSLYQQIRSGDLASFVPQEERQTTIHPLAIDVDDLYMPQPQNIESGQTPENGYSAVEALATSALDDYTTSAPRNNATSVPPPWFGAPEIGHFYGRHEELSMLREWLVNQRARAVAILGMGGQGKTALAASFACSLSDEDFDLIIWRSLVNAPPLSEIMETWVEVLSGEPVVTLPPSLDQQFDLLIEHLHQRRCLLVLDNMESILRSGDRAGYYREDYTDYEQLLTQIAQRAHHSTLLLTSREYPQRLTQLARTSSGIHALYLDGLSSQSGQKLLAAY
ncbi:MAG: BTAD domain-containing putative transcriptional regulator [Chloroflexota bacterium]